MLKNSSLLIFSIIRNLEKNIYDIKKVYREQVNYEKNLYKYIEKSDPLSKKQRKALTGKIKRRKEKIVELSSQIIDFEKLYKKVSVFCFNKSRPYYKSISKRIYNDIENNFYSHEDFIMCYIHEALFEEGYVVDIHKLKLDRIREILKLYTTKQLNKDKEFILEINQELKLNIEDLFKVNEQGESIVFNLIKKNYIHPIFYIKYSKKLLTLEPENINLVTIEYLHFWRLCKILIKNLF